MYVSLFYYHFYFYFYIEIQSELDKFLGFNKYELDITT
jgi:hypothetical protein